MTPTEIWLRLMRVNNLYGDKMVLVARRLAGAGHADNETLHEAGLTKAQAIQFLAFKQQEIDASLQWLEQPEHHLLSADHARYPPQLRAIDDYPGALLVCGNVDLLCSRRLAIIGSRAHSWYGARWGKAFSEALARYGLTITSGLALGIDGIAHRGALAVKGKTIAVLGNGLSDIYPHRHRALAKQIEESGGALLSEFPLCATVTGEFPTPQPDYQRVKRWGSGDRGRLEKRFHGNCPLRAGTG